MARPLNRADIEAAWSAAQELGRACYLILEPSGSSSPRLADASRRRESQSQQIVQLWSSCVVRRAMIQKASPLLSRLNARADGAGWPGGSAHHHVARLAGRVQQETWNVTIYAMVRIGTEGAPNSSHVIQHWEAIQKSLDSIGRIDWQAIEAQLEREASSAIDALSKTVRSLNASRDSSGRLHDKCRDARAAFAEKWLHKGLSWAEIADRYRRDSKYANDSEVSVKKLQDAWRYRYAS